jgi:hypothetical protein
MNFQHWKTDMVEASGLAKDALHIHIGLLLFVVVRLLWRGRGGWWAAWIAALAAALGGEWLDMRAEAMRSALQPDAAHWHDVWNTMLWPTALLIVGRWLHPRAKPMADDPAIVPVAMVSDDAPMLADLDASPR